MAEHVVVLKTCTGMQSCDMHEFTVLLFGSKADVLTVTISVAVCCMTLEV